ncbi:TonB-dependent receptor plug domain-containing protein [Flavobacterium sp.]|jgi:outer membrane receptor protein involved in Fe transport|uniref:TonB-dependent receptor plug domain-containing protein n=1 Tax=Flavobacterium sp. TaxID=239 RepID=UPI0037BF9CF9
MTNRKIAEATRTILAAAGAVSIALSGAPGMAQDLEEVVVTGTRIANPNLTSASQVLAVDSAEIALKQIASAEALLRDLPGVVPSIGPGVNNGNNGAQTVNLRGLGSGRNVVLLDSRRIVPFGLGGVADTSNIPIGLIERVDIVTGGASSVYGADAIAGVTNFITKRNFEGVQIDAGYRQTEENDGEVLRANLLIGGNFADGRGNAVVGLGYQDSKPVLQGNRPFGLFARSSVTGGAGGSSAAAPVVVAGGTLGTRQLDQAGTSLVPFYAPYNFNPLNIYQTPVEKFNIYGQANFQINDSIEAYGQAWSTKSRIVSQIAESATFFNTYRLPISNPFLPVAVRNQICAGYGISQAACDAAAATTNASSADYREVSIGLRRRFVEWGPRTSTFENEAFQIVGGLRGELPADWSWDLSAQYGESGQVSTIGKYGLFSRVQQALRATNTTTCTVTTGGCVPINLFGTPGSMTQAMFNFIDATSSTRTDTSLAAVNLTFTGDFGDLKLPTADERISSAIGAEYREYNASSAGDFLGSQPGELLGAGGADPAVRGKYDVSELFAEFLVPLVTDAPFIKALTLEAGLRYSDYSTVGESTTWKVGGTWEVNDSFRFRSVFQSAVRAPNIGELFFPVQTGLANRSSDPCQGAAPTTNSALRAICIAQGAPAGSIGFITAPAAGQINTTSGGNRDLDTEEAETLTVGFVWSPIDNLTLSLDYFKIDLDGAISAPAIDDVVNGCFASSFNPNLEFNAACSNIRRNTVDGSLNGSPADVLGVVVASTNQGVIETSGLDFGAGYGWDFGDMGRLNWNLNATYTFENKFQATPVSVNRDCLGYYSINCGNLQPELIANQRFTWAYKAFDVSLRHRYLSSTSIEPALRGTYLPAYQDIEAFNYFDLSGRWQATEQLSVILTIDNVTDEAPPEVGNDIGPTAWNSGNTYPTVYDALGRTYSLGVTLKF